VTIRLKSVKNSPQTSFPSLRFLFSYKLLVLGFIAQHQSTFLYCFVGNLPC